MIDRIDIKKSDFGDQLLIHLYEADEQFTISLGLTKKEAKGFMRCLPNIDLKKFIFLDPYNYEKDGKRKIGMGIKQEDEKILYFYNKENGFPSPPNEDMMDIDEFKILMQQQDLFLKKATLKYIDEHFKPAHVAGKIEPNYAVEEIQADDDLPF